MTNWFFICLFGTIAVVPIHYFSVEHLKLQGRYGKKRGARVGDVLGVISGWGFFLFWIGIWVSPQPRFSIPLFQNLKVVIPIGGFTISIFQLIISVPFIISGAWFGIMGVRLTTVRVAETHRTETIVTTGVYSIVRHPQYLGGLLAHVGISFLLSTWFSLLVTPLMVLLVCFISKKEEKELVREFVKPYKDYKKNVPMFLPKSCH